MQIGWCLDVDRINEIRLIQLICLRLSGISCLAVITHTQEDLQSQPFSPEVLSSLWSRPDFLPTIVGLQKTLDVDFFVQTLALRLVKNAVESGDDSMLTALLESDVEVSSKIRSAMAAELFKCFRKYVMFLPLAFSLLLRLWLSLLPVSAVLRF